MGILRYIKSTFINDVKNNLFYMLTLILSIILIFNMFNIIFNDKIVKPESGEYMNMSLLGFIILLVSIVFVIFSNSYYLQGKLKEYAIITLSGRSLSDICKIITIRNAIVTISSLIIGSIIGYLVSPVVMLCVFKIVNMEGDIYYIAQNSLVLTSLILFCELATTFLFNTGTVYRKSINELIDGSKSTYIADKRRIKINGIIYVLAFILPILVLIFAPTVEGKVDGFTFTVLFHIFGIQGVLRYVIPNTISKYRKRKLVNNKCKLIILSNLYYSINKSMSLILTLAISVVLTMFVAGQYSEGTILNIMSLACYGLVVVIVSITVVYKFLIEAGSRRSNFIQLKLLGYTTSEIKKIIITEVIAYYSIIILLSLVSITVVAVAGTISGAVSATIGILLVASYIVVFVLTAIISYFGYKKIALV